jgi:hypothetical protein
MRFFNVLAKVTAVFVLLLVVLTSSQATTVRGGSSYGDNLGFTGCLDNITNNPSDNCEGATPGVFTIGGNSYTGALFVFIEPGGTIFGTLDVIQLSGNSSLSLTLLNTSLSTGVFMCGSFGTNLTVAEDSVNAPMTGLPCTAGSASGGYLNLSQDVPNVTASFSATGVTFVNTSSAAVTVFTEDGNIQGAIFTPTTATSEPASLMLLSIGLLAVGKLRRKN